MNSIPYKNHVHVSGFVGNDPQLRFLPAGDPVMSLRIATKHFWRDTSGDWKSGTEWHTAVLYRQLAQLAQSYVFKKGDFIDLEGRAHTREWIDDRQHKHVSREIIAERFHRVDLPVIQKATDLSGHRDHDDTNSGGRCETHGLDALETFKKLT
jgi:single-strand DNA-binding protein